MSDTKIQATSQTSAELAPQAECAMKRSKKSRSPWNPIGWIRWKVVLVLAVLALVFYFLGLNPLSKQTVNDLGANGRHGARWNVSTLDLGVLSGDIDIFDLAVATARERGQTTDKNRTLTAKQLEFDFDMNQALRKRLYGSVHVDAPQFVVTRNRDGSINLEDFGEEGTETTTPVDWVQSVERWLEKLKRLEEWRRKRDGKEGDGGDGRTEDGGVPDADGRGFAIDYDRRVTYPFDKVTRFVAERIEGSGLEIRFVDESADANSESIPPLTDGNLTITGLSEKPSVHPEPVAVSISGKLGAASLELKAQFDLRNDPSGNPKNEFVLRLKGSGAPLSLANAFAGESLPLRVVSGSVDVDCDFTLVDLQGVDIRPRFLFQNVVTEARQGVRTIAGVDAARFCQLFNDASQELGTLTVNDIHVTGTFGNPRVEIGDTLKDLVTSGAKAFARKQIDKGIQVGVSKARDELGEVLEKKGLKGAGESAGSDEFHKAGEAAKSVLEGAGKDVGGKLKGLFGGGSEEDETEE